MLKSGILKRWWLHFGDIILFSYLKYFKFFSHIFGSFTIQPTVSVCVRHFTSAVSSYFFSFCESACLRSVVFGLIAPFACTISVTSLVWICYQERGKVISVINLALSHEDVWWCEENLYVFITPELYMEVRNQLNVPVVILQGCQYLDYILWGGRMVKEWWLENNLQGNRRRQLASRVWG